MNPPTTVPTLSATIAADSTAALESREPLMLARGVRRAFTVGATTLEVLKGIDFRLHRGELAAIRGASGAGKSTFMHILGLLDRPGAGEVLYQGRDLTALDDEKAARIRNREFGFVFQFFHLLPEFSALENVLMPARWASGGLAWLMGAAEATRRGAALLEQVGLGARLEHLPSQLSGGERQRVAIARALINRPAVVFCDEPTGNLDSTTADGIFSLIRRLNREDGQTFLIVTHDDHVAARADIRYTMRDGRFVDSSP